MKSIFTLAFSLTAALVSSARADDQKLPALYTGEEKIYALSRLWSELKYNFIYADNIDFDQDSLYRTYIPQVMTSHNDVEFFNLLKQYMARFNDGHTAVLRYSYNWSDVFDYAPILVEELNGRYYLSKIWESSGLDSLAVGAEIIRIEGTPTRQYVEDYYFPYIAAGSKTAKYYIAANDIGTGFPDSYFNVELEYRNGRVMIAHIKNNYLEMERKHSLGKAWQWRGIPNRKHSAVLLDWPEKRIARLDFRRFADKDIQSVGSMLTEVAKHADGLIIDLRYCTGGSSVVGDSLLTRIVDTDFIMTGGWKTRASNAYGRAQGNWRLEYEAFLKDSAYETYQSDTLLIDRSRVIKCPIVILTGKATASAAETFLIALYEIPGRPLIIGQTTEGSTGAPLVIDLPHNACARICTVCHLFPVSGKPFVNKGIRPDIEIQLKVEDYLSGYDRVLKEALKLFSRERITVTDRKIINIQYDTH